MQNSDENNCEMHSSPLMANENIFKRIITISKGKLPLTVLYCMVFWNFGICVALFGPTLLDLACQTNTSLTMISWLYFLQNFASLFGCFISGIIIKRGM